MESLHRQKIQTDSDIKPDESGVRWQIWAFPLSFLCHKHNTQQVQAQLFSCLQLVCGGKGPVVRALVNTSGPLQTRPLSEPQLMQEKESYYPLRRLLLCQFYKHPYTKPLWFPPLWLSGRPASSWLLVWVWIQITDVLPRPCISSESASSWLDAQMDVDGGAAQQGRLLRPVCVWVKCWNVFLMWWMFMHAASWVSDQMLTHGCMHFHLTSFDHWSLNNAARFPLREIDDQIGMNRRKLFTLLHQKKKEIRLSVIPRLMITLLTTERVILSEWIMIDFS